MAYSVIDPLVPAWRRMVRLLFKPFNLAVWFVAGFGAWLMQLQADGGLSGHLGNIIQIFVQPRSGTPRHGTSVVLPGGHRAVTFDPEPFRTPAEQMEEWIGDINAYLQTNGGKVIWIAVGVLAVVLALTAMYMALRWLAARGRFMFLDFVITGQAGVKKPWREFKKEGNSLWWYLMAWDMIWFNALLLILAVAGAILWGDFREFMASGEWPGVASIWWAVGVGVFLLLVLFFLYIVQTMVSATFVHPLMYRLRCKAWPAWRQAWREMVLPHMGSLALYGLFNIVLAMAVGSVTMVAIVVTCCLAYIPLMIPYINIVVMLPLLVFMQSYALYFFEQYGEQYRLMVDLEGVTPIGFPVEMRVPPQM
jgi:hypothetical protein